MIDKKAQSCRVRIFDEEYCLVTNEPEKHIIEAAHLVDSLLREVMQGSTTRSDEKKYAIVTALRIASRALKSEAELRVMQEKQDHISLKIDQELQHYFSYSPQKGKE